MKIPEEIEPIDKKILNALSGKADLFTAEAALTEFLGYGWERIKNEVYAFATGNKVCLTPYFKRILGTYPEECAKLLRYCFEEMPTEQRLQYLGVCGKEDPAKAVAAVEKMLPELAAEDLSAAFAVLTAFPTEAGEALLCGYLEQEDWRLKMKAASALGEMGAVKAAPRIREAAAACDATVGAGLLSIAEKLEGDGNHA